LHFLLKLLVELEAILTSTLFGPRNERRSSGALAGERTAEFSTTMPPNGVKTSQRALSAANTWTAKHQTVYPLLRVLFPNQVSTMREVGPMINSVLKGYPKQLVEIKDIKSLAKA
jgi:hypothetical protein